MIPEKDGKRKGYDFNVETYGRTSLHKHPQPHKNKDQTNASPGSNGPLQRLKKSISSFIAGYKSAVLTKIDDFIDDHQLSVAKFNRDNPLWQPRYHDHIIRDEKSYHRIRNYIIHNPKNWEEDWQYPKVLALII